MIRIRKGEERGYATHGWLESYHTFSFANYHDARFTHFRNLRVINEDRVQPGRGFSAHHHDNMEIISYVVSGALEHADSLGVGSVITHGDVQRMSAGTGVTHSEFNPSKSELVHFLQIWIFPERNGLAPSYEQKMFSDDAKRDNLRLIASPKGSDHSLTINADVRLYALLLMKDRQIGHELLPGRHGWLQLISGAVAANDHSLKAGDGSSFSDETRIDVRSLSDAEFLLFDLP